MSAQAMGRVMRAVVHTRQRRPGRCEAVVHPLREREEIFLAVEPATDAGLVGHDHQRQVPLRDHAGRRQDTGDEFEFVRPHHEAAIDIDHAITVEESGAEHGQVISYRFSEERKSGWQSWQDARVEVLRFAQDDNAVELKVSGTQQGVKRDSSPAGSGWRVQACGKMRSGFGIVVAG